MATLALRFGHGPVLLREVAERETISEKYLGQIVIPLRASSLIRSVRGARGGYVLARAPAEISLREIVEGLEGGLDIGETGNEARNGATVTALVIRGVWRDLSVEIVRSLSQITLEEIVRRVRQGGPAPEMYNI